MGDKRMYKLEQGFQGRSETEYQSESIIEMYKDGDSIIKIAKLIRKPVEEIKQILIDNKVTLDH